MPYETRYVSGWQVEHYQVPLLDARSLGQERVVELSARRRLALREGERSVDVDLPRTPHERAEGVETLERGMDLTANDRVGLVAYALLERLSDADDR